MRKVLSLLLVVVFVLAFSSVAFASDYPTEYEGRVESGAFYDSIDGQIRNSTNDNLRFYYEDGVRDEGVIIIPSGAGENVSDNSPFTKIGREDVSVLEAPGRVE